MKENNEVRKQVTELIPKVGINNNNRLIVNVDNKIISLCILNILMII